MQKIEEMLNRQVDEWKSRGVAKGEERVITSMVFPEYFLPGARNVTKQAAAALHGHGPRCRLEGYGEREFILMNSNSYLGLSLHPDVIRAGEEGARVFGAGPGAVRFISGTSRLHVELEEALARFHKRESAILYSAAYSAMMGVLPPLITEKTLVISDELNHNCIINAIRLSKPAQKKVYSHLDMAALEKALAGAVSAAERGAISRVIVVTDGVFSMRGDFALLDKIAAICARYEDFFPEGVIKVLDDSHGVGAFGATGRGTEELTGAHADLLVGTLGKAFGVNGGYAVASASVVQYLRETSPFYIYSNPITPSECAAALKSLEITSSKEGSLLLDKLHKLKKRFSDGLASLGYETIPGKHPITPLLLRDTQKTKDLVERLFENNILATGIFYPVVPRGDEEIRFQINASHTFDDIDEVLGVL